MRRALGGGNVGLHDAFLLAVLRDGARRADPRPPTPEPETSDSDSEDDGAFGRLAASWADADTPRAPAAPRLPDPGRAPRAFRAPLPPARLPGPGVLGPRMDDVARSRGLDGASPAAAQLASLAVEAYVRRLVAPEQPPGS